MKQNWIDTSVLDSTQAAQYIKARHKERGNAHHDLPRRPDGPPVGQHHGDAQHTSASAWAGTSERSNNRVWTQVSRTAPPATQQCRLSLKNTIRTHKPPLPVTLKGRSVWPRPLFGAAFIVNSGEKRSRRLIRQVQIRGTSQARHYRPPAAPTHASGAAQRRPECRSGDQRGPGWAPRVENDSTCI